MTSVTDGWIDEETDGQIDRIPIAIPRLHFMQRDKKQLVHKGMQHLLVIW